MLQRLRAEIARLEGFSPPGKACYCPTGWPAIDAALPGGGLLEGALHEIHAPDPVCRERDDWIVLPTDGDTFVVPSYARESPAPDLAGRPEKVWASFLTAVEVVGRKP